MGTNKKSTAKKTTKKAAAKSQMSVKKTAEEISAMSLYFDFYGGLLSGRQKEAYTLYYDENLSLSEIANVFKISRQGVHEALKKAENSLVDFERKLGLVKKNKSYLEIFELIDTAAGKVLEDEAIVSLDKKDADRLRRKLRKISAIAKSIED